MAWDPSDSINVFGSLKLFLALRPPEMCCFQDKQILLKVWCDDQFKMH